jgi:hypothetical protein
LVDLESALVTQLKPREIADYRQRLLTQQQGRCALCGDAITAGEAVLDHDHATGYVRGVLHRGCNALEGQIVNAMPRNRMTAARLAQLFANWAEYHAQHLPELHPQHRTPEQRAERARKRARRRRIVAKKQQP